MTAAVLLQLQGVLDALVYGWTARGVRRYLRAQGWRSVLLLLLAPLLLPLLALDRATSACTGYNSDRDGDDEKLLVPN